MTTESYSDTTNAIPFPKRSVRQSTSDVSAVTTRTTAIDVCYSVYGEASVSSEAVDRFYETNASDVSFSGERTHNTVLIVSSYENPFITATSRSVIGDIHKLSHQLSSVDVPRPLAVICTLFHLKPPTNSVLFQALRVWTDIIDICENETFDGHRKAIVEHTLNILLLPGLHCEGHLGHRALTSGDSLVNVSSPTIPSPSHPFTSPSLPIPGTSLSIPSPLHLKLRIVTRLSFNEQGLVTHHRDIWDVKDVVGLVPGVSLAQWIGTRLAASGLSYMSRLISAKGEVRDLAYRATHPSSVDLEHGL